MKCGCHDLAGEAASARSHRDRDEALHPPRASAMQSPLLRPRHGASGVWTPSCISSAHSRSSSAHALSPLEIFTETSADAEHLRQALSGVGCLALLHRHEHGIPTHPHGLAVRPVRRRARPGQPRCRTTLPTPASRARAALPGAAAACPQPPVHCRSAHAPFGRAARRTHRAQRPALRHNHRRAGASPDAPLRGRLRAP